MPTYTNTCTNCGGSFSVDSKSKHDPNNLRKFKRACSLECTRQLKSFNMSILRDTGVLATPPPRLREIDMLILEKMYCRDLLLIKEIAGIVGAKESTISREIRRHGLVGSFYRECPQCACEFTVATRSMANPDSNKFKKFCSRSCFLSSRKQCGTWIEREISACLDGMHVPYASQVEFGRLTVDFFLESARLVIEANGDFWHANPEIYGKEKPFHRFHQRIVGKDARKASVLASLNIDVYTVWEKDLRENRDETLEALRRHVTMTLRGAA